MVVCHAAQKAMHAWIKLKLGTQIKMDTLMRISVLILVQI